MSLPTRFELKPLSKMMHVPAISVLLLAAMHTSVQADQLIGESRTIGPHEMKNDWQLDHKSELTVNGARAGNILANDSTLNVNTGSRIEDIRATQGSTVNVDGATVESNHSIWGAVRLDDSAAIIRNSAIISHTTFGLQAYQSFNSDKGGIAQVFNSIIRGEKSGAIATGNAELHFNQNTVVEGTGADSDGVWLDGATATASQSSIIGGKNGVLFTNEAGSSDAGKLVLDNSSVEGRNGSAIVVEGHPGEEMEVEIDVRNGSTLTGGNGVLLEVNGGAQASMNVDSSRLKGDVIVEDGSTAHLNLENSSGLKGQLQNVTSLNVGNGSYWELTADSQVGALNLVDGTVIFGHTDAFYQLDLDSLDGNGTFVMGTDFANGITDFLNISGEANGSHSLLLAASGTEPVSPEAIRIVHTGGGDAQFSLAGDVVDVGAYSYGLKKDGTDWFLDPNNRVISPATRSVMALFNTAPTVWYGEATSLRTRMGELRFEPGQAGVWMRGYGNKYKVAESTGVGYNQNQQGFTLGADTPLADSHSTALGRSSIHKPT